MNQDIRDALPDWLAKCLQIPGARLAMYAGDAYHIEARIKIQGATLTLFVFPIGDQQTAFRFAMNYIEVDSPAGLPAAIRRALGVE